MLHQPAAAVAVALLAVLSFSGCDGLQVNVTQKTASPRPSGSYAIQVQAGIYGSSISSGK